MSVFLGIDVGGTVIKAGLYRADAGLQRTQYGRAVG